MKDQIKTRVTITQSETNKRLSVAVTKDPDVIIQAQRLRYQVFAEELGARLTCRIPGVDEDRFDPYCEHLVARDEESGEVVGTYRLLTPGSAARLGHYYTESEFDKKFMVF